MNLLLNPSLWWDYDTSPPIAWNAASGRYEYLVNSTAGQSLGTLLELLSPTSSGDSIEFSYAVDAYVGREGSPVRLMLRRVSDEVEAWGLDITEDNLPLSGGVSIICAPGELYTLTLSTGIDPIFYAFEAIITPEQDDGPSPEDGCFWTDLQGVTQECGGDVGGQWVPLHMAGIAYDLNVMGGEGSIAGSTVTIDTEYFEGSVWWLTMEGFDGEIRLRVTPLSFTATGGDDGGGIYTPATLDVENDNDGYYQIGNQAPPYPATNFPPFVPEQVGSWENSMLSDIRAEGYLYFNYHIGRCNGDGAPMHEQGQFLVEIWAAPGEEPVAEEADAVVELLGWPYTPDTWAWKDGALYEAPSTPYPYPEPVEFRLDQLGTFSAVTDSCTGTNPDIVISGASFSTNGPQTSGCLSGGYSATATIDDFDPSVLTNAAAKAWPLPEDQGGVMGVNGVPLMNDGIRHRVEGSFEMFGSTGSAPLNDVRVGLHAPMYSSGGVVWPGGANPGGEIPVSDEGGYYQYYAELDAITLTFSINAGNPSANPPASVEFDFTVKVLAYPQLHVDAVLTDIEAWSIDDDPGGFEVPPPGSGVAMPDAMGYVFDTDGEGTYALQSMPTPYYEDVGNHFFLVGNLRRVADGPPGEVLAKVKFYGAFGG